MITPALVLLTIFLAALFVLALPTGRLLAHVLEGGGARQNAIETRLCRLLGIDREEMAWWPYTRALLLFNGIGIAFVFLLAKLQHLLPFADGKAGMRTDTAWNAAVSFVSNTNWQAWAGEVVATNFTQMAGFAVQNFLSAATGLAVAMALIRGFARDKAATVGNFWLDVLRGTVFVLLPLSLIYALFLVQQGSPQTFATRFSYIPLEPAAGTVASGAAPAQSAPLWMPIGPVASQEAIKMLGTNGGGIYNANSAHPFENPTPLTNFVQMLSIFLLPAGLCALLGLKVGDIRQGRAIIAAMTFLFLATVGLAFYAELRPNPALPAAVHQEGPGVGVVETSEASAGGNLEGKEVRFGAAASTLFAAVTTAASCGAVNAMHDSFLPLGGLVPLFLMQLGEVVFGGVGAGLYGILLFAILAVFLAGLMIGRTPEYLGKKIEPFEMKMTALILLVTPALVLGGVSLALMTGAGRAAIGNPGPHGFTQIVYAVTSAANNNGSAFGGVSMDTPFWNHLLAAVMLIGRFAPIVPVLAIAGSLAGKKKIPASSGTLPTHGPLFVLLLVSTVVVFGALTYLPTLALGPIAEHFELFH